MAEFFFFFSQIVSLLGKAWLRILHVIEFLLHVFILVWYGLCSPFCDILKFGKIFADKKHLPKPGGPLPSVADVTF